MIVLPVVVTVGALTALRVVRRSHSRRAEAELWAEAITAADTGT